jgi:hypothetical protein
MLRAQTLSCDVESHSNHPPPPLHDSAYYWTAMERRGHGGERVVTEFTSGGARAKDQTRGRP